MSISRSALEDYFRRRAGERIAEIEALRAELGAGDAAASDAETALRTTAHQLAGTSASFGFPEIGELARKVEFADRDELDAPLDDLVAALEVLGAGGDPPKAR